MNDTMTLCSIAGYSYESALWKLLIDICDEFLQEEMRGWLIVTPDSVYIEDNTFHIDGTLQDVMPEFIPPEGISEIDEAAVVWSIGAVACFVSSGHYIFGGRGGAYQKKHPKVDLPVLRKDHSALTPLVQRCLCYSPAQRISIKDLKLQALKGLEQSEKQKRRETLQIDKSFGKHIVIPDDVWPEKMY